VLLKKKHNKETTGEIAENEVMSTRSWLPFEEGQPFKKKIKTMAGAGQAGPSLGGQLLCKKTAAESKTEKDIVADRFLMDFSAPKCCGHLLR
jgi:hypothetical protein